MLGATVGPPAVLGPPVSYGVCAAGRAGVGAVALAAGEVGVRGLGGGLRLAVTVMDGSVVLPDGFGVVAAGTPFGDGGCCGGGGVCAQVPTLSDEIKNDVDANNARRCRERTRATPQ
jgi:hypothetical protein